MSANTNMTPEIEKEVINGTIGKIFEKEPFLGCTYVFPQTIKGILKKCRILYVVRGDYTVCTLIPNGACADTKELFLVHGVTKRNPKDRPHPRTGKANALIDCLNSLARMLLEGRYASLTFKKASPKKVKEGQTTIAAAQSTETKAELTSWTAQKIKILI